jgi:hypothetical protein
MKITSINYEPEKYGRQWFGNAIDDGENLKWFYQPGLLLHVHREERPGMWIIDRPTTGEAKLAVLKAVWRAKQAHRSLN